MIDIKDKLPLIRKDIDALLAALAPKHGLRTLRLGNATYDSAGGFTFKLEGVAEGGASKEEQLYDLARLEYPELPLRGSSEATFVLQGVLVTLFGANATTSKLMYRRPDGKVYLTPTAAMAARFAAKDAHVKARGRFSDEALANALVPPPVSE